MKWVNPVSKTFKDDYIISIIFKALSNVIRCYGNW